MAQLGSKTSLLLDHLTLLVSVTLFSMTVQFLQRRLLSRILYILWREYTESRVPKFSSDSLVSVPPHLLLCSVSLNTEPFQFKFSRSPRRWKEGWHARTRNWGRIYLILYRNIQPNHQFSALCWCWLSLVVNIFKCWGFEKYIKNCSFWIWKVKQLLNAIWKRKSLKDKNFWILNFWMRISELYSKFQNLEYLLYFGSVAFSPIYLQNFT